MLDHYHTVASRHQTLQHGNDALHIGHMQANRRFIEYIQGMRRFLPTARDIVAHLGQLRYQLQALRLAAAERR